MIGWNGGGVFWKDTYGWLRLGHPSAQMVEWFGTIMTSWEESKQVWALNRGFELNRDVELNEVMKLMVLTTPDESFRWVSELGKWMEQENIRSRVVMGSDGFTLQWYHTSAEVVNVWKQRCVDIPGLTMKSYTPEFDLATKPKQMVGWREGSSTSEVIPYTEGSIIDVRGFHSIQINPPIAYHFAIEFTFEGWKQFFATL